MEDEIIRKVRATHHVRRLEPMLHVWIELQLQYWRAMNHKDFAWWYRECTAVGFLASAVWKAGGVALLEWQTKKGRAQTNRKGRCDLYIYFDRKEFFVEAKFIFSDLTNPSLERGRVKEVLDRVRNEAARDLQQATNQPKNRYGVLFVVPYVPSVENLTDRTGQNLEKLLDKWRREVAGNATAEVYLPSRQWRAERGETELFPGIAMYFSPAKRGRAST